MGNPLQDDARRLQGEESPLVVQTPLVLEVRVYRGHELYDVKLFDRPRRVTLEQCFGMSCADEQVLVRFVHDRYKLVASPHLAGVINIDGKASILQTTHAPEDGYDLPAHAEVVLHWHGFRLKLAFVRAPQKLAAAKPKLERSQLLVLGGALAVFAVLVVTLAFSRFEPQIFRARSPELERPPARFSLSAPGSEQAAAERAVTSQAGALARCVSAADRGARLTATLQVGSSGQVTEVSVSGGTLHQSARACVTDTLKTLVIPAAAAQEVRVPLKL